MNTWHVYIIFFILHFLYQFMSIYKDSNFLGQYRQNSQGGNLVGGEV